jgi:uncharacterized protein YpmS
VEAPSEEGRLEGAAASSATKKNGKARVLIPLALAILAVVVVAVVVLTQQGTTSTSPASESQPITLKFVTPNYDEETSSEPAHGDG